MLCTGLASVGPWVKLAVPPHPLCEEDDGSPRLVRLLSFFFNMFATHKKVAYRAPAAQLKIPSGSPQVYPKCCAPWLRQKSFGAIFARGYLFCLL